MSELENVSGWVTDWGNLRDLANWGNCERIIYLELKKHIGGRLACCQEHDQLMHWGLKLKPKRDAGTPVIGGQDQAYGVYEEKDLTLTRYCNLCVEPRWRSRNVGRYHPNWSGVRPKWSDGWNWPVAPLPLWNGVRIMGLKAFHLISQIFRFAAAAGQSGIKKGFMRRKGSRLLVLGWRGSSLPRDVYDVWQGSQGANS